MAKRFFTAILVSLCLLTVARAAGQQTGRLKGRIEDPKGKPVAGADVRVMNSRTRALSETQTNSAGEYTFELEPDSYTVSFDAEGFQGGNLVQMQQVEAGKETTVKTIQLLKAKKSSLIRGAVFDANGQSLAGVRIKLVRIRTEEDAKNKNGFESLSRDYVSNSRGEFAFRLPSVRARYRLTATLDGYKPDTKEVDVSESEAVPVAFSLEPVTKNK